MISFILVYLIGIPVSVLLHEVGHAIGFTLFSKGKSYVYLGASNDKNKQNFRIGSINFHVKWAYFGFCSVKNRNTLSRFQNIMFMAGGPIVSFLLFVGAYLTSLEVTYYETNNFLNGITYFNLILFIFTSIPIIYPKWLKPYAGLPSDGYQILTLIKGKSN
ncbi:hypothetical protein ACQKMD_02920 [Viridibacillus sp. NPDC096237]|uniref:hypothetical protein n=1 Tax=Viridibacillus sp. NPDC096237 TaxID=3390721 RepID=UPI003D06A00B